MKTIRLLMVLCVGLLIANAPASACVIAPSSPEIAVTAEEALSAQQLKKQQKQEIRAQKRAERQAKFLAWFNKKLKDSNEQLVAVLLAFFLGGLGIHRVYLKSKPIIILWYFLTLGGIFGLIPLIDFIRLIIGQVDHYRGNNSLFRAFQ